jgi:hypothetical protein
MCTFSFFLGMAAGVPLLIALGIGVAFLIGRAEVQAARKFDV